jgi:hypothetical protein
VGKKDVEYQWNFQGSSVVFEGLELHQVLWCFFVWTDLNGFKWVNWMTGGKRLGRKIKLS